MTAPSTSCDPTSPRTPPPRPWPRTTSKVGTTTMTSDEIEPLSSSYTNMVHVGTRRERPPTTQPSLSTGCPLLFFPSLLPSLPLLPRRRDEPHTPRGRSPEFDPEFNSSVWPPHQEWHSMSSSSHTQEFSDNDDAWQDTECILLVAMHHAQPRATRHSIYNPSLQKPSQPLHQRRGSLCPPSPQPIPRTGPRPSRSHVSIPWTAQIDTFDRVGLDHLFGCRCTHEETRPRLQHFPHDSRLHTRVATVPVGQQE